MSAFSPADPPGFPDLDRFHDPKAITLAGARHHRLLARRQCLQPPRQHSRSRSRSAPGTVNPARGRGDAEPGPRRTGERQYCRRVGGYGQFVRRQRRHPGQIISADGDEIGGEFSVTNQSGSQWTPAVAALADGRFFVVWEDLTGDGDGSAIKGQVFTASGIQSGEAFRINTSTADDQTAPTVTALANGDALVTWTDHDGATSDIYSQVINLQSYVGDGSAETVHGGSLATLSTAAPAPTSCTATAATTYSRTLRLTISTTTFWTAAPAPIRSIWTTMSRSLGRRCCSAPTAL